VAVADKVPAGKWMGLGARRIREMFGDIVPKRNRRIVCANASPKEAPAGGADTPSPTSRAAGTFAE
jgi:hypothetical protein